MYRTGRNLIREGCVTTPNLRLDRPVDRGERLTRRYPRPGIDENAGDASARARNSNRLVTPSGQRPAGGHGARNFAPAGNDHGNGRNLAAGGRPWTARECRVFASAAHQEEGEKEDDDRDSGGDKHGPPTP